MVWRMPTSPPPSGFELTSEAIRSGMAIPSEDGLRGQKDGIGFARDAATMAAVYEAAALPPVLAALGPEPGPDDGPILGAICPHDDYLYAGRVYRRALERITAKTVIVIGVFHAYRKFDLHGILLDDYDAWRTPDGPAGCSPLRELVLARFPGILRVSSPAHDHEHSIEPIVSWLKHRNRNVEILPVLAPTEQLDLVAIFAAFLARPLVEAVTSSGLRFGHDVQVVISADAVHYGPDFGETRFGVDAGAHERASAEDRRILREILSGPLSSDMSYNAMSAFVDPWKPDAYRWPWCGRFSVPFGLELLGSIANELGTEARAWPLAYETSLSMPPLDVHMPPLGTTAPATPDHFVGYPAVAFTLTPLVPTSES
jgi:AmmeMemoRadiSam system protein B